MMAKSGEISAASSFMILAGSISGPGALLGFSFCNNFRTPSAVTLMSGIAGNLVLLGVGMLLQSSLVHVDSYCLFRMSALSFASAWSLPFSFKGAIPLASLRRDLMIDQNLFCLG